MEPVILVEVLDAEGEVVQRLPLRPLPINVGRGFGNQLILDDEQVSTLHARIEEAPEGGMVLVDAGSRNGLFSLEANARVERVALTANARVRLGTTVLRFRTASEARGATALAETHPDGLQLDSPAGAALGLGALLAMVEFKSYSSFTHHAVEGSKLAEVAALSLVLVLLWAGAWSLASRVAQRRFHLLGHVAVFSLGGAAMFLVSRLLKLGGFALGLEGAAATGQGALFAAIVGACLFRHLRYCASRWSARRTGLVSGAVVLGGVAVVMIVDRADRPAFTPDLHIERSMEPPAFRLREGDSPQAFFEHARDLRTRLDQR